MEQIIQWIQETFMGFPPIGIADILDILIMAFIFYKLLMIVRRTSSGQVMKGVLLVIVAFCSGQYLPTQDAQLFDGQGAGVGRSGSGHFVSA